jgi:hypothetical protein
MPCHPTTLLKVLQHFHSSPRQTVHCVRSFQELTGSQAERSTVVRCLQPTA